MRDPIIVVSLPRSGSSMVAGAFAKHGVWVGTCKNGDQANAKGYFENQPIADLIRRTSGPLVHKGVPAPEIEGWRDQVESVIQADGYVDGPWLWKGSAMYAPLWHEFDPTVVTVRRNVGAVSRSGKRSGRYRANTKSVGAHLSMMERLESEEGAVAVDSAAVVSGDLTTLESALRHAGIEPDRGMLMDWIDPSLWMHGG